MVALVRRKSKINIKNLVNNRFKIAVRGCLILSKLLVAAYLKSIVIANFLKIENVKMDYSKAALSIANSILKISFYCVTEKKNM